MEYCSTQHITHYKISPENQYGLSCGLGDFFVRISLKMNSKMAFDFFVAGVPQVKLAHTLFGYFIHSVKKKAARSVDRKGIVRTLPFSTLTCMSSFNLEPNNYRTMHGRAVNGSQLGKDYIQLKSLLQPIRIYSRASLYGPNIGRPRKNVIALLDGYVRLFSSSYNIIY